MGRVGKGGRGGEEDVDVCKALLWLRMKWGGMFKIYIEDQNPRS